MRADRLPLDHLVRDRQARTGEPSCYAASLNKAKRNLCWSAIKNDCCTVCGEIATSEAPTCSICGRIRFMASSCATQNGHQRPRKKQITTRPLFSKSEEEIWLPL